MNEPILKVQDLKKYFEISKGMWKREKTTIRAVDGVSFDIERGKTLGLVGESGSGKTTIGRLVLRLLEATEGKVHLDGTDIFNLNKEELRRVRRKMQIVFQDPYGSLNPRMTVGSTIGEALIIHRLGDKKRRRERVAELLELVGLENDHVNRYPHEFSGGQRQRFGIARALSVEPELIIADEPVSALDVSIRAQIMNLFKDLQDKLHLTYLFIAHDLNVTRFISHKIAVIYSGRIVEMAETQELFSNPLHPYTKALLDAVPVPDPRAPHKKALLRQDMQNLPPLTLPSPSRGEDKGGGGCCFLARCSTATDKCKERVCFTFPKEGHMVRCCEYK
jgi:oligopeptide/dipeptide ABC transporter ATP-binding protein